MQVRYAHLPEQFIEGTRGDAIWANHVRPVVQRGDFTLGAEVGEFEHDWAELTGFHHAIGVRSGTDAIALALLAATGKQMPVQPPRHEFNRFVITVANTFMSTVGAIIQAGFRPALIDADDDMLWDDRDVGEYMIDGKGNIAEAFVPVAWTGHMRQITRGDYEIGVVVDAAQAIGSAVDISGADAVAYSMHPLKNVNVWGDGGAVSTDNEGIANRIRSLRNHGLSGRDTWMEAGFNARLETIQAAVARAVIPTLAENLSRRRANARAYDSALKRREIPIKLPPGDRNEHAFHAYVIRAEQRDALQAYLAERGVESKIHYKTPLHLQPALRELGYRPGQFPVAEKQATEILSLPIHQFVREEQIAYVAESIHNFYGG